MGLVAQFVDVDVLYIKTHLFIERVHSYRLDKRSSTKWVALPNELVEEWVDQVVDQVNQVEKKKNKKNKKKKFFFDLVATWSRPGRDQDIWSRPGTNRYYCLWPQ